MRKIYTYIIILISLNVITSSLYSQCPNTITHGGQTYNVINIGGRCWMKENLNIGTRINASVQQTKNSVTEKYCYDNLESNCAIYGGLYQWGELVRYYHNASNSTTFTPYLDYSTQSVQGLCPDGWRIPTNIDWQTLFRVFDPSFTYSTITTSSSVAGGKLKENGFTHWNSPNTGATSSNTFNALGGGQTMDNGSSGSLKSQGYYASIDDGFYNSYQIMFENNSATGYFVYSMKSYSVSVRCIKLAGVDNGIEDINLDINQILDVFPVPATKVININFKNNQNKDININLVNIKGETVYQQNISKDNFSLNNSINLDNVSSGNYILNIVIDGKSYNKKIVVEKNK